MSNSVTMGLMSFLSGCLVVPWVGLDAIAQVVPDQTLPNNSAVMVNGSTIQIDEGTTVGSNLFHSFSDFSVSTGKTAFFNNGLAIDNILARVTGKSFSNIDGVIKANGSANLFLMNPNGILLGPNASLDIGGSFVATTANAITFPDGSFGAANPQSDSLLTVNVPVGLQYGKAVQPIIVNGSSLNVKTDKTLALVGGDVSLDSAQLFVSGGHLELGSLGEPGTVELKFENNIPRLSIPKDITRGNVLVKATNIHSDDLFGNGTIAINAKDIDIRENSLLGSGLFLAVGGDIKLDATNDITIDSSRIRSFVDQNFQGSGGNIDISTGKSLFLDSASKIQSVTLGDGHSGDIKITTGESLSLKNSSQITTITASDGHAGDINIKADSSFSAENNSTIIAATLDKGDAGNINISGGEIFLSGRSSVRNSTFSQGDAGTINIAATGSITLDEGFSSILIGLFSDSTGNGGDLKISTGSLLLINGASLASYAQGLGTTGDILITATDKIQIDGASPILINGLEQVSSIANFPPNGGLGQGGDIVISTGSLSLTNGGAIGALKTNSTFTQKGNIKITATDDVNILGASNEGKSSIITSSTLTNLPSGDITIKSPVLNVSDQGGTSISRPAIIASSASIGNAGNIFIDVDSFVLDGGQILSFMDTESTGDGGSINILGSTLNIANGGGIRTTTFSTQGGKAGDINISLSKNLTLSGNKNGLASGIFADTETNSTGNGGTIFIDPLEVMITDGASISVNSLGSGIGGNISLFANSLKLDNGTISASTANTNGGNINLNIPNLLFANNDSRLSATAGGNGDGGNLTINSGILLLAGNSNLTANAFQGNGGKVTITAQGIIQSLDSDIAASSQLGINGTVQINTPGIDPNRGLVNLPENIVDASGLVSQQCSTTATGRGNQQSEFLVTGRGGLPSNPSEPLQNDSVLTDWITLKPQNQQAQPQNTKSVTAPITPERIVVAQGWSVDKDGAIILTAPSANVDASLLQAPVNCHGS